VSGRPDRAVADIRHAVRSVLAELTSSTGAADGLVLVACSGGADSLALAAAVAFECRHTGWRCGAVVVDHGLQPGATRVADDAAEVCRGLGLAPVVVVRVEVRDTGQGLEAAAREARYAALTETADRLGAAAVLLGHTRDDQAEQVLLGLVRGSGTRSLAGMPAARGIFRRPLLGIPREDTRAACRAEGVPVWDDPMNEDPTFARVRARRAVADLERDLGPGVAAALARSAEQLRADADLLDRLAVAARADLGAQSPFGVDALAAIPAAVRTRVWRLLLIEAGAPPGRLGARHTDSCDRLLTRWRGQGPLHLPGDLRVDRVGAEVHITPARPVE
jgi:tRNA(Ile)-lysidine synthase